MGPLEALYLHPCYVVDPGQPPRSVITVAALDPDTGTTYGVACDRRAALEIAEALADPWELPPVLFPEPWQILWVQEAEQTL